MCRFIKLSRRRNRVFMHKVSTFFQQKCLKLYVPQINALNSTHMCGIFLTLHAALRLKYFPVLFHSEECFCILFTSRGVTYKNLECTWTNVLTSKWKILKHLLRPHNTPLNQSEECGYGLWYSKYHSRLFLQIEWTVRTRVAQFRLLAS